MGVIPNHLVVAIDGNPILLLENIKTGMLNLQSSKYPHHAIHGFSMRLYKYIQGSDTLIPDYHKYFHNHIYIVENNGVTFRI